MSSLSRPARRAFRTVASTRRNISSIASAKERIPLDVHPEVEDALETGKPVVALESTIITHGKDAVSYEYRVNTYCGGIWQMTASGIGTIDQDCFELNAGCYKTYGFDYQPGNDGYITWVYDDAPAWAVMAAGLGPDNLTEIGQRPIPEEPMYLITNLGISSGFSKVQSGLTFPAHFKVQSSSLAP
ncbi:hypothetical protein FRC04_010731 [Tulasnella sp. 424]|nr:hypothetical protein FRC04_010731 [Tulasnella sp. 424]